MESIQNKQNGFIYYDKVTGKVLNIEEAKAEWERASNEKRPSNLALCQAKNLVIENGYVKSKFSHTIAELMNKSSEQKENLAQTTSIDASVPDIDETPKTRPDSKDLLHGSSVQRSSEDIDDPDYILRILKTAQASKHADSYSRLINSSVADQSISEEKPIFERSGKRKAIKYNFLAKGLVAIGIVAVLFVGAKKIDEGIDIIKANAAYNTAVTYLKDEYSDTLNFVNKNKITIPGSFDEYAQPMYWIDTEGVAQDILKMPDEGYMSSLYLAYEQMDNDRVNGEYHNWDYTIASISSLVDESRPNAFSTTSNCADFNDFLIKGGYIDPETGEPSAVLFEKAGRQAVIDFANYSQTTDPNRGGR